METTTLVAFVFLTLSVALVFVFYISPRPDANDPTEKSTSDSTASSVPTDSSKTTALKPNSNKTPSKSGTNNTPSKSGTNNTPSKSGEFKGVPCATKSVGRPPECSSWSASDPVSSVLGNSCGNRPFKLHPYPKIVEGKRKLNAAYDKLKVPVPIRYLLTAIAMQETNNITTAEYDKNKKGDAANYTVFNVNRDMLKRVYPGGFSEARFAALHGDSDYTDAVRVCVDSINKMGVHAFMNWHRGGATGGCSGPVSSQTSSQRSSAASICKGTSTSSDTAWLKIPEYLNGIATIVRQICKDPKLMTDSRRVEVQTAYV